MSPSHHMTYSMTGVYVLSLVILLKIESQGAVGYRGTRFVLGFLDNNSTLLPELLIISQSDVTANVTVQVPGLAAYSATQRVLRPGQVLGVQLGLDVRLQAGQQTRQSVEVISTSDVAVYGVNPCNDYHDNTDVFFALPNDALGDEYYVASYKPNASQHRSQLGVIAVQDDTIVNVTIPILDRDIQVTFEDKVYGEGEMFRLHMNAYDTVQLESQADLTGLKITANRPVAMVSGDSLSVESEDGMFTHDHFVEQLTPTRSWGKSFVSMAFSGPSSPTGDVFRVIARSNDTKISVKDKRSLSKLTLSESQHTDLNITADEYITIEASKPVQVLQYLLPDGSITSHPPPQSFMLTVPPSERSQKQYLFSIVSSSQQTVTVVVNSSQTDSVLLDGQHITLTLNTTSVSWVSIEGASADYSAVQLPVHTGIHNLTHAQYSPNTVFTAMSPSNHLGMRIKDKPVPYIISNQAENDVIKPGGNIILDDAGDDKTVEVNGGTGNDVISEPGDYRVKIVAKEEQEVNLHETNPYSESSEGLSSTVIAVIVSLATAVFFVIACIVGFLAAEFVCRRENFPSAKVAPYVE